MPFPISHFLLAISLVNILLERTQNTNRAGGREGINIHPISGTTITVVKENFS